MAESNALILICKHLLRRLQKRPLPWQTELVDDTVALESESSEQGSDPSTLMEPWANIPESSIYRVRYVE